MNKKNLELQLAKLNLIPSPKATLEQYDTPAETASEILWLAFLKGDIQGKVIADLGCGSGVLGIGALLLGAKKVYFIDVDKDVLKTCKDNLKLFNLKGEVINTDISLFDKKVDTVIQNPPFGVQYEHADRKFLEKAMEISNVIYSIHKIESERFIKKFSNDNEFELVEVKAINMRLRKIQDYHKKDFYKVKVGCFLIKKA